MDAQRLLGQFLGTQPTHQSPIASSRHRSTSGGSIESTIGKVLGGALGGSSHGRSTSSGLSGALAGGLASHLLGGRRRRSYGGSSAKLGGMAMVAGLAYKAFQQYQAQNQASAGAQQPAPVRMHEGTNIPTAEGTRFQPAANEAEERARLLLSAMIAAAKADGYIDQAEQDAIFGRIDDLDLDAATKGFVMDEMRKPVSIEELVRRTPNQEVAVEVYTASVMAIDPDHPAEKAYLDMLAARLNLPADLVAEIRRTTGELAE